MSSGPPPTKLVTVTATTSGTPKTTTTSITPHSPFGPNTNAFTNLHRASRIPIPLSTITHDTPPPCIPSPEAAGSLLAFTDYAPGSVSPLHQTPSVDYVVVISGNVILELDDGEEVRLGPGEVLVQAGAKHRWRNEGTEWCRVLFVMLGADVGEGQAK